MKFFYFLKIIFDISTSKQSENIKKIHFKQKKIKIFENTISNTPLIFRYRPKHIILWIETI